MKGELKPVSDRPKYDLAVCPWCGGPADFECLENGRFSVGCNDNNGECLGFQLMTTFATKREARDAWNTRSLIPGGELEAREALKRVISAWESLPGAREYSVARAQSWISGSMKPAIDHARAILAALTPITPDGGDRMREALQPFADAADAPHTGHVGDAAPLNLWAGCPLTFGDLRRAREALQLLTMEKGS